MVDQFCPHCGTEVDGDARFCPTCGRTLAAAADEAGEQDAQDATQIPPAPAWPPPTPEEAPEPTPAPVDEPAEEPAQQPPESVPPPAAPPPLAPVAPPASPTPPPPGGTRQGGGGDMPITLPTMLSGWLIGGGSGLAALALLPRLASVLNVFLFLGLLWVTATIFLADRMPQFAHRRLATLGVVAVALGAALDRSAFRVSGVDSVFLVMMLVAAGGVLLLELGRDRPVPPPGGPG